MPNPDCIKCDGGVLRKPEPGAQYECDNCGAVVNPEFVQTKKRPKRWRKQNK